MVFRWDNRSPERPDRYLDWEVLNRAARGDRAQRWCSVLIQLDEGAPADKASNLKQLKSLLERQPSDDQSVIKIHDDEMDLLESMIAELDSGRYVVQPPEDPGLSFFVYMPEAEIYSNGHFADTSFYQIRLAGPPIPNFEIYQGNSRGKVIAQSARRIGAEVGPAAARAPLHASSVAVGIIDDGLAFANERFRRRQVGGETTRVKHLWLQYLERMVPDPDAPKNPDLAFGRQLDAREIDQALVRATNARGVINENEVYRATGANDFEKPYRQSSAHGAAHGTAVMDVACGYAPDERVDDDRPILAVQLPERAVLDTSGVTMATYVLQGLRQIMLWADKLDNGRPVPLVVNFSYGLYAGPKDGWHILEREIDRLVKHRNRTVKFTETPTSTALVLPAGNTYLGRVTAKMSLQVGEVQSIDWIVLPDGGTPSFLEIWMPNVGASSPISVALTPPAGAAGPTVMPGPGQAKVLTRSALPIGAIYFDNGAASGTRSRVFLAINPTSAFDNRQPTAPSGAWKLTIHNTSGRKIDVDLFVQREDTPAGDRPPGRQSYFEHKNAYGWDDEWANYRRLGDGAASCPITHDGTLSAIANGEATIVVGAAIAAMDRNPPKPAPYTSSGATAGRLGPDWSAVAEDGFAFPGILAAGTRSESITVLNGTSVAAPQVTRQLADLGVNVDALKLKLGCDSTTLQDPRLGFATVPAIRRADIPSRKRPQ